MDEKEQALKVAEYSRPPQLKPPPKFRCDICDNGIDDAWWNFCPWCGEQENWREFACEQEKDV